MNNKLSSIIENSENILKGKKDQVRLVLSNILAGGHTLIEDSPGVGKTTLVKYLAKSLGREISRIQFTNDLLPSDILGTSIFNKSTESFVFHKGPIFGEFILADELNRAPPKTQSALLQAMEEKSISIESNHFDLPEIFTVIATQNPQIQIGTFNLPESQLDRFSMKIKMGYPDKEKTLLLLKDGDTEQSLNGIKASMDLNDILELRKKVKETHLSDEIYENIYKLLTLSRNQSEVVSLSNRAGIDLVNLTKSHAYMNGRDYVIPDDLYFIFPFCAGHRLTHPDNASIELESKLSQDLLQQL